MNRQTFRDMLTRNEGKVLKLYQCSAGHNTIGVGHNLDAKPISEKACAQILEDDIDDVLTDLDRDLPWWRQMDENRQLVLADLCFNMGISTLLTFRNTLQAMREFRYRDAAQGIRNSLYAKQVGNRAERNALIMETGNL